MDSVDHGSADGESDLGDVVSLTFCWYLLDAEDEDGDFSDLLFLLFFFEERFSDFFVNVFSFFLTAFLRAFLSLVSVFMPEEGPGWLSSFFRNA